MREIRIDFPGAGEWIMAQSAGSFTPGFDHSFATYRNGNCVGGFVTSSFLGNVVTLHMAGRDKHWCSRELLFLVFHYAFVQLGCHKVFGPCRSTNLDAIDIDLRGGWEFETVIRDAFAPGVHLVLLGMTRDRCKWLNHTPRSWVPGTKHLTKAA